MPSPSLADCPQPESLLRRRNVWIVLAVWLGLAIPLFICMPLNSDTALFDVQARLVLDGGVAYRDIVEPNLPGVLWGHLAIRTVLGWSSEVIRLVDLIVLLAVLAVWGTLGRTWRMSLPITLLAGTFFYLTRNEWCHAQRDMWMLLPAGCALHARLLRSRDSNFGNHLSVIEGICWGCAFWIKPHVAVPATVVLLTDLVLRKHSLRMVLKEVGLVITGGLAIAVPGIVWLISTGAWEHFWIMMLEWNPEYLAAAANRMSLVKWELMARRFAPWPLLHLVAIPIAIATVIKALQNGIRFRRWRVLLASCYLGWLVQSLLLQHALDYIHVPAILLAIVVVTSHRWDLPVNLRRPVVAVFAVFGILCTPFFLPAKISQWPAAVSSGSTSDVRASLAHGNMPQWSRLSEVVDKLKELQAQNGEVTCLNVHSVHVYNELGIHPATRYWSVNILQELFPQRAESIALDVMASGHRYVIVEDTESQLTNVSQHQSWLQDLTPILRAGSYQILLVPSEQVAQREAPAQQ